MSTIVTEEVEKIVCTNKDYFDSYFVRFTWTIYILAEENEYVLYDVG